MTFWRGRRRAAVSSALRAAGVAVCTVGVLAVPGIAASEVRTDDPRNVGTRLDLKTLTHAQDGPSIVYTAETYAPFSDQIAVFKWGVDRDRDESFDLIVFTEWRDGKLVGGVKDVGGRQVATATVSRPGPTAIRVSFPSEVLGDAAAYRYAVSAETAPGERDLVPNSGLIQHRIGAVAPAPAPAREAAAAAPAPAPVPAPTTAHLPRTGPADRALLSLSGLALLTGGAFVTLGARRSRTRRCEASGGIR